MGCMQGYGEVRVFAVRGVQGEAGRGAVWCARRSAAGLAPRGVHAGGGAVVVFAVHVGVSAGGRLCVRWR